jgi:hypothetical protein
MPPMFEVSVWEIRAITVLNLSGDGMLIMLEKKKKRYRPSWRLLILGVSSQLTCLLAHAKCGVCGTGDPSQSQCAIASLMLCLFTVYRPAASQHRACSGYTIWQKFNV